MLNKKNEISKLQENIATITNERDFYQQKLIQAEAKQINISPIGDVKLSNLEKQLQELRSENNALQEADKTNKAIMKDLDKQLTQREKELVRLKDMVSNREVHFQNSSQNDGKFYLHAVFKDIELNSLRAELADVKKQLKNKPDGQAEIATLKSLLEDRNTQIKTLQETLQKAQESDQAKEKQISQLNSQLSASQAKEGLLYAQVPF